MLMYQCVICFIVIITLIVDITCSEFEYPKECAWSNRTAAFNVTNINGMIKNSHVYTTFRLRHYLPKSEVVTVVQGSVRQLVPVCDSRGQCTLKMFEAYLQRLKTDVNVFYCTKHDELVKTTFRVNKLKYMTAKPELSCEPVQNRSFTMTWKMVDSEYHQWKVPVIEIFPHYNETEVHLNGKQAFISNLHPGKTYNITLVLKRRAKHKTGLEKATCIRTVGPCTPEIVPEFISFTKGSNSTEIMVYVSKVPEYLHNGPNFEYVISKQTDERSVNFRLRTKNSMGWCRDSKIVSIPYDFEDPKVFRCLQMQRKDGNTLLRWDTTRELASMEQIRIIMCDPGFTEYEFCLDQYPVEFIELPSNRFHFVSSSTQNFGIGLATSEHDLAYATWFSSNSNGLGNYNNGIRIVNLNVLDVDLTRATIQWKLYNEDIVSRKQVVGHVFIHYIGGHFNRKKYIKQVNLNKIDLIDNGYQFNVTNLEECTSYELTLSVDRNLQSDCWIEFDTKNSPLVSPVIQISEITNSSVTIKWGSQRCSAKYKNLYYIVILDRFEISVGPKINEYIWTNLVPNTTYALAIDICSDSYFQGCLENLTYLNVATLPLYLNIDETAQLTLDLIILSMVLVIITVLVVLTSIVCFLYRRKKERQYINSCVILPEGLRIFSDQKQSIGITEPLQVHDVQYNLKTHPHTECAKEHLENGDSLEKELKIFKAEKPKERINPIANNLRETRSNEGFYVNNAKILMANSFVLNNVKQEKFTDNGYICNKTNLVALESKPIELIELTPTYIQRNTNIGKQVALPQLIRQESSTSSYVTIQSLATS